MAINFPSSPTEGQKFYSGTVAYTFSGGVWNAARLDTALPFNYLVNPAMAISQQNGTSILLSPAGLYPADQWAIQTPMADAVSARSVLSTSPNGSPNIIRLQVSTAATGGTNTRYFGVVQYIEGQRLVANGFGNFGSLPMVLRFWAKHPASGTWGGGIRNGNSTRGFAYSYTIQSGEVNAWKEVVVPILGDTTGTWAKDNTNGMAVWWTITNNYTTLEAVAGSWVNGNIIAPIGLYNGTAVVNALFELADVGLYLDPLNTGRAPPWQAPSIRQVMFDCQRYWQKQATSIGIGIASTASPGRSSFESQAPMRVNPTATLVGIMRGFDQATAPNLTGIGVQYSNTWYFENNYTCASAQTAGRATLILDTNMTTIYMVQNARM